MPKLRANQPSSWAGAAAFCIGAGAAVGGGLALAAGAGAGAGIGATTGCGAGAGGGAGWAAGAGGGVTSSVFEPKTRPKNPGLVEAGCVTAFGLAVVAAAGGIAPSYRTFWEKAGP